ncbi:MAG: DivIVA domain-containing protein [Bacteroidia bacterium]|nr:DivIVA domain-containing protein [Bacteroidia bacterium]MDW8334072.1 DivIVA domain-containing protein [Bacteroidia bacterium]
MITPLDIKQQTFGRALRGYDVEEVKAFLTNLSREWEEVLDENRRLKAEIERVKDSLRTYKDMEAALHRTLQQAEQTAASTSEAAKREAETLLREARQKAQDIVESARRKQEEAERETRELVFRRDGLAAELKTFLLAQLERLKLFEERIVAFDSQASVGSSPRIAPVPSEAPSPPPRIAAPMVAVSSTRGDEFVPPAAEAPPKTVSFFESALSPPKTPDFLDEI